MKRDTDLRDHIISTSVSLGVGIGGFFGARVLSGNPAEAVALAVVAGIVTHLIFDRIAYRRALHVTRNDIVESLRVGTPFESGYRVFKKESDANAYLLAMLPNASLVWNTRISDHSSIFARRFRQTKQNTLNDHDKCIAAAVASGAECRFLIERQRRDEINYFVTICSESAAKAGAGGLIVYTADFDFKPVLQMLIMEDSDGNGEVLVGWGVGKEEGYDAPVLLFRDKAIVIFFKQLYEKYTVGADVERF